jgi:ElaB/YqjD/DUF883 family membrane-anchored ribosome-binding protein
VSAQAERVSAPTDEVASAQAERVSAPADDVASAPPAELVAELYQRLRREVEAHPYRSLAIAAGVGYLLGTRLGAPVLSLVGSRLGSQVASSLLAALGQPKP